MFEIMHALGNRRPHGGSYEDFLAWYSINGVNTATKLPDGNHVNDTGWCSCVMNTTGLADYMWGTPYKSFFTRDSRVMSVIRHACPTLEIYNNIINNKLMVAYNLVDVGLQPAVTGLDRNGYKSSDYSQYVCRIIDSFVYYDHNYGVMMEYNPNTASEPVPFDFRTLPVDNSYRMFASSFLPSLGTATLSAAYPTKTTSLMTWNKTTDNNFVNLNQRQLGVVIATVQPGVWGGWGTSFMDYFTYDSAVQAMVAHAFRTLADRTNSADKGRSVVMYCEYLGAQTAFRGLTRNGVTTNNYGAYPHAHKVTRFIFEGLDGTMKEWNPSIADSVIDFTKKI